MNQNEREGQSIGRTTGASGEDAEQQQNRAIEGQDSEPGKAWQESDKGPYTGQGDRSTEDSGRGSGGGSGSPGGAGGADTGLGAQTGQSGSGVGGGTAGESSGGNPQGSYAGYGNTNVGGSDPSGGSDPDVRHDTKDEQPENAEIDESQWQGNRFSQGGGIGDQGGSNG